MSSGEFVTVCVLTRNRLGNLHRCLESVRRQMQPDDRLLVGDTGSSDGTLEYLEQLADTDARISVVALPGELDFAGARNALCEASATELVAFIDDDCEPDSGWLDSLRNEIGADIAAAGGPAVMGMAYAMPWWWTPEVAWTVGMSGPGVLAGLPGYYPAASNMILCPSRTGSTPFTAARHSMSARTRYLGGREDADWWLGARRSGLMMRVAGNAVVKHSVPASRFHFSYVLDRARADGASAAMREKPTPQIVTDALNEAAGAIRRGASQMPWRTRKAAADLVWAARQSSYHRTATGKSNTLALAGAVLVAGARAARRQIGRSAVAAVRLVRPRFVVPENPKRIAVIAPTYFGDTVLLRPAIAGLRARWPEATIRVLVQYPELCAGLGVEVVGTQEGANSRLASQVLGEWPEISIVPYYHFGDPALYRWQISRRAAAFSSDLGLQRQSDYLLAPRQMEKDFMGHEVLNLAALFAQWPGMGIATAPPPTPTDGDQDSAAKLLEFAAGSRLTAFQIGSALPTKSWPLEYWATLVAQAKRDGFMPVFVGGAEDSENAGRLAQVTGFSSDHVLCGKTTPGVLMAVLRQVACLVCPCSGPKHLAMALGVPTFTLYGPSSPERWGALSNRHLHGYVRCPARDLTARERNGLPVNHEMLLINPGAAAHKFARHLSQVAVV